MNALEREHINALKDMVQKAGMTSYEKETATDILEEFVHYVVTRERQQ